MFDIHEYIASGISVGLKYSEIRQMETFNQLNNILVVFFGKKDKKPTQAQIDMIT